MAKVFDPTDLDHIVDASGQTDVEGKSTENYDVSQDVIFLEDELNK